MVFAKLIQISRMKVRFLVLTCLLLIGGAASSVQAETSEHAAHNGHVEKVKLSECRVDAEYDAARLIEDSAVFSGRRYYGAFYHHSFLRRENWLYIIMDPFGNVTRQEVTKEDQMTQVFQRQSEGNRPESFNPAWLREQVLRELNLTLAKVATFQCE